MGKNELVWLGFSIDVSAKMRNFRSKPPIYSRKAQLLSSMKNPSISQVQSAAWSLRWVSQICPWMRPFLAGRYAFFENRIGFGKKMAKNSRLRVKNLANFSKIAAFPHPETFRWNRLKVKIYTDACARSPFESESINWDSSIGIGRILVISGNIVEFPSLEVGGRVFHRLKGLKSPRRLISFFELLGGYLGIRLWAPSRLGGNDLTLLAIPIATGNLGNDSILRKHYTSSSPSSWMLRELAARSLTTNTAIISKHMKGGSGKWSIWAGKLSRNVSPQIDGAKQRATDCEDSKLWFTNIRDKSAIGILGAPSLNGKSA